MTIVHILRHGRSYCGMPGVPGEWPSGHKWLSFEDVANAHEVNCHVCVDTRRLVDQAFPKLSLKSSGDLAVSEDMPVTTTIKRPLP